MASEAAKTWLVSRLSAADNLIKSHPPPQIWLLTGLVLMTHATWSSLSSEGQTFTPGLPAPFKPTDTSALRRLSVSEAVKPVFGFRANDEERHVSGTVIHETGKYPGLRGWAAQWERIDIKVTSADKGLDAAANQIKLKSSPRVAVLKLDEEDYAQNDDGGDGEDLDDEYWDSFLEKADEYI